MEYHAKAVEKMSYLFNMINRIEPLEKLQDFARNYNIKTDLREIDVDIEEIERNKEKRIREEQEQVNKVFGSN